MDGMRGNRERRWSNDVSISSKEHNNNNNNNMMMMMKQRGNGKVCDVTEQPRKQQYQHDVVPPSAPPIKPKPVDEDLYKIPPELLRTTKRKKMLGFISKCLLPTACVS